MSSIHKNLSDIMEKIENTKQLINDSYITLNRIIESNNETDIRSYMRQYNGNILSIMTQLKDIIGDFKNSVELEKHEYDYLVKEIEKLKKRYGDITKKEKLVKKYKTEKQSKERQVEINNYEISRYKFYIYVLQFTSIVFISLFTVALLTQFNWLPPSISTILVGLILFSSSIYYIYLFYDYNSRSKFDFYRYSNDEQNAQSVPGYLTVYDYDKQHLSELENQLSNQFNNIETDIKNKV